MSGSLPAALVGFEASKVSLRCILVRCVMNWSYFHTGVCKN